MKELLKYILYQYYIVTNFLSIRYTNFIEYWQSLKAWAFEDGEVVYKAHLSYHKGYQETINKELTIYVLFAIMCKILNLQCIRNTETFHDAIYLLRVPYIISYYKGRKLHHEVIISSLDGDPTIEKEAYPKLCYLMVNDKYDITDVYNLFKQSLQKCHEMTAYEVMELFLMYKYRNKFRKPGGYRYLLTCVSDDTLEEYVFKADDIFTFHGAQLSQ